MAVLSNKLVEYIMPVSISRFSGFQADSFINNASGYQVYIERLNSTSIKQGYSVWLKVNIKNRNMKAMIVCVWTSSTITAEMSDIVWTSLSMRWTQVLRDKFNLKQKNTCTELKETA